MIKNKDIIWKNFFKKEKKKDYFIKLIKKINMDIIQNKIVYPKKKYIFNIFKKINFNKIKVVILGQDPYYNDNQANGLAFSVMPNIKIPPTLKNIYQALKFDIPDFIIPKHGYLIDWVNEGVMLLNSILTVIKGKPKSHYNIGWEKFTDNVIKTITLNYDNIVFLLWGTYAKKKSFLIKNNLVLTSSHPSPFSFYKGFYFCKHFSKANKYLIFHKQKPINWNIHKIL
ncbi:uracil-DNA glycosylase [Enterobacteriaceae endosymbiont of Donacia versicolorea]|uniref:uracil-DNA glycosylase n=1 Tax=Enterobacteriaceae endosymbiont of Donacia versicolorea TaxID=2675788 RepID=UPI001449D901|nr:uracil-DNA glycosylase [Enterobacteriaceae endosymbiont of Donacia versicolorea]QJC32185.1 uracil-DNA glycosylase [Enterobacteriaceae endosymbiont of Donacia versicolorea]